MHAWWPKLRRGGLLSGDDYGDEKLTEFLDKNRTKMKLQVGAQFWHTPRAFHWGVVRAAREFAEEVGAVLHVSWLAGKGELADKRPTCYLCARPGHRIQTSHPLSPRRSRRVALSPPSEALLPARTK